MPREFAPQEMEFRIEGYSGPIAVETLKVLERRAARARARVFAFDCSEELMDTFLNCLPDTEAPLAQLEFPISQVYPGIPQHAADQLDKRHTQYEQNVCNDTTIKLPNRIVPASFESNSGK